MADRALGKKPGTVVDPRTLQLDEYLAADWTRVPKAWRIAGNKPDWPMFRNDTVGDCTCASLCGHRVVAQEASAHQREVPVTDKDVLDVYGRVTGWPAQDPGAYLIDVLRDVSKSGFGREKDGTPHTIGAYAKVTPGNTDRFKQAAHLFGGLYLGLALPTSAQREINLDLPWTATSDAPYSWGGHAVWMVGYDPHTITVVTWGGEQKARWDWVEKYVDEAWALVSEDFLTGKQRTPQGLDLKALAAALTKLGK